MLKTRAVPNVSIFMGREYFAITSLPFVLQNDSFPLTVSVVIKITPLTLSML